jgi:hypothetical protein
MSRRGAGGSTSNSSQLARSAMRRIRLGPGSVVFLLFFGVATLEAFQSQNWLKAAFWLAIGIVFLTADNVKRKA